jgi:hypothetical protein
MKFHRIPAVRTAIAGAALAAAFVTAPAFAGIGVTPTTNSATLATALSGSGVTVTSVSVANGAASQFGTFSGFSGSLLNLGSGVVLSSGNVIDTALAPGSFISTNTSQTGTSEFNAYGPGHIANFSNSFDVAALKVDFTLASASAVSFSFAFGSVEYPDFVSSFTDAFLAFLDGTSAANQIVFDASNNPVQVGASFASSLTTADTSTAYSSPHGIVGVLTTTTGTLAAGAHTIYFEVGDVNDHILDSAVFLGGISTANSSGGGPVTNPAVPEPGTYALMALGLAGLAVVARRRRQAR